MNEKFGVFFRAKVFKMDAAAQTHRFNKDTNAVLCTVYNLHIISARLGTLHSQTGFFCSCPNDISKILSLQVNNKSYLIYCVSQISNENNNWHLASKFRVYFIDCNKEMLWRTPNQDADISIYTLLHANDIQWIIVFQWIIRRGFYYQKSVPFRLSKQ